MVNNRKGDVVLKRLISILLVFILTFFTVTVYASGSVHVKGYFRKDGTYVQPHYRSAPDGNPYNNWSFPGNVNPYTGEIAPGQVDTYLNNYYNNNYQTNIPQIQPQTTYGFTNEVKVMVDGNKINLRSNPVVKQSTTLVPMRDIFEALGATVGWDEKTQIVTASKGSNTFHQKIGAGLAVIDGETVDVDVPAQMINNTTFVPVRVVSEALGETVGWDGNTNTILINTIQPKVIIYTPPTNTNDYQGTYNEDWNNDSESNYQEEPQEEIQDQEVPNINEETCKSIKDSYEQSIESNNSTYAYEPSLLADMNNKLRIQYEESLKYARCQ